MIRPKEGKLVGYLSLLFLLVGLGMAVGRSSSDALLFKRVGVEFLPQMFFLTSLLLVATSAVYAEFADRVPAGRLFRSVAALLAVFLIVVWYAMAGKGAHAAFAVYFIGYGVASEILLVHLNLYASGFLNATQAKRLFPLVNAASRLGGVIGGATLGLLSASVSIEHAALAWVAVLVLTWGLLATHHRGEKELTSAQTARKRRRFLGSMRDGLHFARGSSLLQITGLCVFIMVVLISMQDYLVSTILTRHFHDERDLAAFFGWFFALTNLLVLLLQLLATNRLLRRFGLKTVSLIFPWSTAFTFGLLSISPSLVPAVLGRFNYTGMMPAFRNPASNLFYNALPSYMQGRARALTLGLILPLGLAVAGLMLMVVPRTAVGASLAMGGLLLSLVYVYLKSLKNRVYSDTLIRLMRQQVFLSGVAHKQDAVRLEPAVIQQINLELGHDPSEETFLALADWLIRGAPDEAVRILLPHLSRQPLRLQDQLMARVAALDAAKAATYVDRCLHGAEPHLRVTAVRVLELSDTAKAVQTAAEWLVEKNPRLRGEAIRIALSVRDLPLAAQAKDELASMLAASSEPEQIAALHVVATLGLTEYGASVRAALDCGTPTVRVAALVAAAQLVSYGLAELGERIAMATCDAVPSVRLAALAAAPCLTAPEVRAAILAGALEDEDYRVRGMARDSATKLMPDGLSEYAALILEYDTHFRMQSVLARHLASSGLHGREVALARLVRQHLAHAWAKMSVATMVPGVAQTRGADRAGAEFLGVVLAEEVDQHIDLALEILGHLDRSDTAVTARAALASRDSRCRAQAVESVRNIDDGEIVRQLLPLLETRYDGAVWTHRAPVLLADMTTLIAWCGEHGGLWLRFVANTMGKERILGSAI